MSTSSTPSVRRPFAWSLVLLAVLGLPVAAGAPPQKVPPAFASLLPKGAVLDTGSWGVFDTSIPGETSGEAISGDMRAEFPGAPPSCDFTIGPELRVELKSDSSWVGPMVDMAVQIQEEEIAGTKKSLAADGARLKKNSASTIVSIGAVKDEKTAAGRLLYYEYTENCEKRQNAPITELRGFARKGMTFLSFNLRMTAGAADTKAIANDILSRFQKFDPAAAKK